MGKLKSIGRFIRRHSATILSCIAAGGTIATGVFAAKGRPKADERIRKLKEQKPDASKLEVVANGAISYLPAITIGGLTIASIFGSNYLNKKQQAELTMLCAVVSERYGRFRQKVGERHGEEEVREIQQEVEAATKDDLKRKYSENVIDLSVPDKKLRFRFRGEVFERYEREVMDAEYHINRNFTLRGYATVNEFREFLGLDQFPQEFDEIGWSVDEEFYWIDFEHRLNEDGTVEIVSIFPPCNPYDDDDIAPWEPR